ncbi:hypothetical protein [Chloroflexus sp.]|uniref:hypothetical protein n=1 Tax=Chloroflexus sp. TaxID=1904827 RepID=UPI00404AED99
MSAELAARGLQADAVPVEALIGEGATAMTLAGEPRLALAAALTAVLAAPLVFALLALAVTFLAPSHRPDDLRRKREQREEVTTAKEVAPQQAG